MRYVCGCMCVRVHVLGVHVLGVHVLGVFCVPLCVYVCLCVYMHACMCVPVCKDGVTDTPRKVGQST